MQTKTTKDLSQFHLDLEKKFAAHDADNRAKAGDIVKIRECVPISKSKSFEVVFDDAAKS